MVQAMDQNAIKGAMGQGEMDGASDGSGSK